MGEICHIEKLCVLHWSSPPDTQQLTKRKKQDFYINYSNCPTLVQVLQEEDFHYCQSKMCVLPYINFYLV